MLWALPVSLCPWECCLALELLCQPSRESPCPQFKGKVKTLEASLKSPWMLPSAYNQVMTMAASKIETLLTPCPFPANIPTLHKTPSRNVCSCHFFLPSILPFQSALVRPPAVFRAVLHSWVERLFVSILLASPNKCLVSTPSLEAPHVRIPHSGSVCLTASSSAE